MARGANKKGKAILSIVIVTYNSAAEIEACLSSIETSSTVCTEVILIDNGSDDGTLEFVGKQFPHVQTISNAENRGFSAACNQGLAAGSGEYVLLLNPDTEVHHHALEQLLSTFSARPDAGIVGPRLINPDGRTQRACARRLPGLLTSFFDLFFLSKLLSRVGVVWPTGYKVADATLKVQGVCGAALCFPRSLATRIGSLDERLPMGAEDIDFCARALRAGVAVYCNPSALIVHIEGASMRKQRWKSHIRYQQVLLVVIEKYHPGAYALCARGLFAAGFLFRALVNTVLLPFEFGDSWFRLRACLVLALWCVSPHRS